ncbi:hypothetical protein NL108_018728 [Boleophthalmus pectinirostris]|nr:hypothetical protein NL108_018728 [Boleophthalmus pectinirostris]
MHTHTHIHREIHTHSMSPEPKPLVSMSGDLVAEASAFDCRPDLCTGPIWNLLQVVGPREDSPTSLIQTEPSQAPWGKARPPGAHWRAPTPGLAPGWGPSKVAEIRCNLLKKKKKKTANQCKNHFGNKYKAHTLTLRR